jgi:hypothetical protein
MEVINLLPNSWACTDAKPAELNSSIAKDDELIIGSIDGYLD